MMIRERLGVYVITTMLFTLLFSNLISRIICININGIAYVVMFIAAIIFYENGNKYTKIITIALFYLIFKHVVNGGNLHEYILANIEYVFCLISVALGFCNRKEKKVIDIINKTFAFFVVYGLVQQVLFYSGNIDKLIWDVGYVELLSKSGVKNLYQNNLLRFFGAYNSFQAYQVSVLLIAYFLYCNVNNVKSKYVLNTNIIMSIAFTLFSFERTPLLFMYVLFVYHIIKHGVRRGESILIVVLLLHLCVVFNAAGKNIVVSDGSRRIVNMLTFNHSGDDAITSRKEENWESAFHANEYVKSVMFGVGPQIVSPRTSYLDGHINPHNQYLYYYIGYGLFGCAIICYVFIIIFSKIDRRATNCRNFLIPTTIGILILCVFNQILIGKVGYLYFYLCGYMSDEAI